MKKVQFSNRQYDHVRNLVRVGLPAFATFYYSLGKIWGFPSTENVVGSIVILTTFLGVLLSISDKNYTDSGAAFDGDMVVTKRDDALPLASLELGTSPNVLLEKDRVVFKVVKDDSHN